MGDKKTQLFGRVTLDVDSDKLDFIERVASYENEDAEVEAAHASAAASRKKQRLSVKGHVSRKSLCERLVAHGVDSLIHEMAPMIADLGPLPDAKDRKAMAAWAARAYAWKEKRAK